MLSPRTLIVSLSLLMPFATYAELPNFASSDKPTVPIKQMGLSKPSTEQQPTPPATESASTEASVAEPQTEKKPKNQKQNLDTNVANTEKKNQKAPESTTKHKATSNHWSIESINTAEWSEDLSNGQLPVYAKAQVLLNRKHASPGAIDGTTGKNTLKAISAYQTMNGLSITGKLNAETWQSLTINQKQPAFIEYKITNADVQGPYATSIPSNYAEQAKMKGLYYTRITEMLGEKFHMDEAFLKMLNPKAKFVAGETIIVANARNDLPEDITLIVAHKGAKQLYLFNSQNKMIASFPATIGSADTPSPTGTYKVKGVAANPWYSYNPKNFIQGNNTKPLSLPPGPNNPVGNVWIGLSKPSFGIHGTPNPSLISKTASHGCIRLTNWDALDLSKHVKAGVTVKFLE